MRTLTLLFVTLLTAVAAGSGRGFGPTRFPAPRLLPRTREPWGAASSRDRRTPARFFGAATEIRGGGKGECADSNRAIAAKAVLTAGLETACLLGVIRFGEYCAPGVTKFLERIRIPIPTEIFGLPVAQWLASAFVVFSSSTIKSWLKGSVSAASNQALRPNVVPGDPDWYAKLKKPWFNPPGWVFPIMWLIVSKPTQLAAVTRVIKTSEQIPYWPALTAYCAHLALGDAWNDVFFGCQRIGLGAGVIASFLGMLAASSKLLWDVDPQAGRLMLPTCGWVTVAAALNWRIYALNK